MRYIGRYRIQGLLGKGGMATVYKVEMPVTDKVVALKLMTPPSLLVDIMGEEELKHLFISEAVTMTGLHHPNIADVWDVDEHDGKPFFIMEFYCNNLGLFIGETFRVEERSRVLEVEKVFHYGRQVLEGLACLHQAGIIHRDIKPYNILITDQDTVKIADFGMSKLHGDPFPGPGNLKVGSPFYAAPEQEQNPDDVDERADLYSTGVMLYRMLTGELPDHHAAGGNKSITILDEEWHDFLRVAVAKNPAERFQSAGDMLHNLMELEKRWHEKKENVCRFYVPPENETTGDPDERNILRSEAAKIKPSKARNYFGLDNLWRPLARFTNDFETREGGIVVDHTTKLIWQQAGTPYHVTWEQAHHYIDRLNNDSFAGRQNWRLPTVNELTSLLTVKMDIGDYCIDPIFDSSKKWLWSADRRSYVAAWYVSMDMGFVAWQDFSCYNYLRAVCTAK